MKFTLALASIVSSAIATLPAIEVKGNAFFDSDSGDRFYIRGVDYQPGGSSNLTDPLADKDICSRDIPYFKDLGINTVRVYSVDNTQDHDDCMKLLDDAGIYLILDVNTPDASISRHDPGCSYNHNYLQQVFATVDMFSNYTNTLGFFAANELINDVDSLYTAPYAKAVVRDMKKYIKARNYRSIPVGYSAADVSQVRGELADYLNCGNDSDARIDMLGVNDYSWCGQSSFTISGYKEKVALYDGFSVPIFLSEFGCNEVSGSRPFTEIGSIYSTQMSGVFSGGLVYEYSEEGSKYGLVKIDGDSVTTLTDYDNLKKEYSSTSDPTGDAGYTENNDFSECPTGWNFSITVPDTPSKAEDYFKNGVASDAGNGFDADTQGSCDDDTYEVSTTVGGSSSNSSKTDDSSATASGSAAKTALSSSASGSASSSASKSSKGAAPEIDVVKYSWTTAFLVVAAGFFM
ncbi:unnamed protein product [Ambrosiozyma monospora]|uniref:1,3-beta-glucanosyltransferase n=1 Tax=Ambrosiozyma monospora TaxID=43982 RepID=A0A9W6YR14_AMBMO|nr:unnamed protein product [Ambrosiozyma monospora]